MTSKMHAMNNIKFTNNQLSYLYKQHAKLIRVFCISCFTKLLHFFMNVIFLYYSFPHMHMLFKNMWWLLVVPLLSSACLIITVHANITLPLCPN